MAKELKLATAPWCGPCKMVKTMIADKGLKVDTIDIDEDPDFAARYGIRSIPMLLVFDENGTVIDQVIGDPGKIVKIVGENQ